MTIDNNAKPMNQGNSNATKWQVPSMEPDPNRVIRSHSVETALTRAAASIPTAEEVEQWRQQAVEEGYQEGLQKAQAELEPLKQRFQNLIEFLDKPLEALNEEVEQQLTQVAVTLAQQLVRRELRIEPGEIVGLIRDSVKLLPGYSREISILIHPEDASLVRSALSIEASDGEKTWDIVEDPTITRGGCEIKAGSSTINVTLENRLAALAASVLGGDREHD